MTDTLLATKLYIPSIDGEKLVTRPILFRLLDQGVKGKLTLVSAPAGFGKSTLVSTWLNERNHKVAWVSLGEGDDDQGVFWLYILSALQCIEPGFGIEAKQILNSPQLHDPQPVLVSLLNEIINNSYDFTLVLDDYHMIESPEVNKSLSFFLEHMPSFMHVIILTRMDPPFSLGRLRVEGDLSEIRAADLQFSHEETLDFLCGIMKLHLNEVQIRALEKHTEGWVVGLKLAALSLQRQEDPTGFINAFSGSHRYILEYLTEEVLISLSEDCRKFLLFTSILDSFNPALCDSLLDDTHSSKMIEELQADNIFVIPLDQSGNWFRYHHLFSQMLQSLLQRDHKNDIPALHLQAASWYRQSGYIAQAVEHAFRSGDLVEAKTYVVELYNDMLHRGGVNFVLKWVNRLPIEMAKENVYLALAHCWARYLTGQTSALAPFITYAEVAIKEMIDLGELSGKQLGFVESQIYMMRSALLVNQGEYEASVVYAKKAVEVVPAEYGIAVGPAWNLLGAALVGEGNMEEGIAAYRNGVGFAYDAGNFLSAFAAVFWSTAYKIKLGQLVEAFQFCQRTVARASRDGLSDFPAAGLLYVAMALIALEQDQLEIAKEYVEKGGGFSEALRYGRYIRARLYMALGEFDTAVSIMQDVERIVMAMGDPFSIAEMHYEWGRMNIGLGNDEALKFHFNAISQTNPKLLDHPTLCFSYNWLAAYCNWYEGKYDDAMPIVENAIQRARATNSKGELLRFLILYAVILDAIGELDSACVALEEALMIGAAENLKRLWLDVGKQIVVLLDHVGDKIKHSSSTIIYFENIVSLCNQTYDGKGKHTEQSGSILTERELEILHLICQGYSNPEVSKALVVTLNTVKKHTSNIYSKLDVSSRTQAIAKARELNLF